jgi:FkbM family methyltransferase
MRFLRLGGCFLLGAPNTSDAEYSATFKTGGQNSGRAMSVHSRTTFEFGKTIRELFFRQASTDEDIIRQIFVDQEHDLSRVTRTTDLLAFGRRQETRGLRPLIIDAGANIGVSPIYFLANLPNAHVVAIEPDVGNFELLMKNVEGLDVESMRAALSASTGRARVLDPGRGYWAYRTQPISDDVTDTDAVPRVTVNSIYASHRSGFFPFLVKVDIEGAEGELFSGNTEWVALTPLIIVELHDWMLPKSGTSRTFLRCVANLDRDFITIGNNVYSIANDLDALAPAH